LLFNKIKSNLFHIWKHIRLKDIHKRKVENCLLIMGLCHAKVSYKNPMVGNLFTSIPRSFRTPEDISWKTLFLFLRLIIYVNLRESSCVRRLMFLRVFNEANTHGNLHPSTSLFLHVRARKKLIYHPDEKLILATYLQTIKCDIKVEIELCVIGFLRKVNHNMRKVLISFDFITFVFHLMTILFPI
jgi:hypothetical protein